MRVYVADANEPYLEVNFTNHCFDVRPGEYASRKSCLMHADYIKVIKSAYLQGLLSFKGNQVVITIANSDFSQQVSILCDVVSYTKINIVTIKHHWRKWDSHRIDFIRVRCRINLYNYDFKLTTFKQSQAEMHKSALFAHKGR